MRLLAILVLVAACSTGQPQPQIPQSNEGNKTGEKGSTDTAQLPPSNKQKAGNPNKDPSAETAEKVDSDRRIANYTEVLAIVGVLQFFALIIQAFFLYKAFAESRHATEITRASVEEAVRSNGANEALIVESNRITLDATELTRQSLLLTHRPKLIARMFFYLWLLRRWMGRGRKIQYQQCRRH